MDRLIPLAVMEAILKKAGAARVGEDAKAELKKILESEANKIAANAVKMAKHAGRRTIIADDILMAIEKKVNL